MQRTSNFTSQQPKIGLERYLLSNIKIDSFYDVDENDKFDDSQIDLNFIENMLNKNTNNINKYKNEGVTCIYDEKIFDDQVSLVNYTKLLEYLVYDETAYDNFIGEGKGKWIQNLNEAIFTKLNENIYNSVFKNDNNNCENLENRDILESNNIDKINYQLKKTKQDFFKSENQNLYCSFESRFESGNLRMANHVAENEYDLILKNDINSGKTSNWFFFKLNLKNQNNVNYNQNPQQLKFNIINCLKADTLFSKGLKVLYYIESHKKWYRNTKNNYYFSNSLVVEDKKLHTLTFSIDLNFEFEEENFFFSYCYPYTFTHLQSFLDKIMNNNQIMHKNTIRHEVIGKTLAGNNLDMLIITKFDSAFEEIAYRPCIILTARVHPGESNSSYVIQGVIEFLIENNNHMADLLRKTYIFKIVPMLNPDGVVNGNFRTSLIGKDLNRLWDDPRENICPTIFYTKEMIKKTLLSRDIFIYCDFHGHSNKPNFFLYGCPSNKKIKLNSCYNLQETILAKIFSNKNDMFDHKSCTYKIAAKKLKTARAVLKNEFNIDLSYCLESSIGHITNGEKRFDFFTPRFYEKIGKDFCVSIFDIQEKNIFNEILSKSQNDETNKVIPVFNYTNNHASEASYNYNDTNNTKKGKDNTYLDNLSKPIKEKFKEKARTQNNKNSLNSISNNVSTINFIQYEKEEVKNLPNINIFNEKLKKKKKKLNPIKSKRVIISTPENEIGLPSNMKILNLNTSNSININININNINNYNTSSNNLLSLKNSESNKSLSEKSVGVSNYKMNINKSNLQVIPYNNINTQNTNEIILESKKGLKKGISNINSNKQYDKSEKFRNISVKLSDNLIKENIVIKTNSVSAKINEYSNMKNDTNLFLSGILSNGFTDPNSREKYLIKNNNISSKKEEHSPFLKNYNNNSDSLTIDPYQSQSPNSLLISKENSIYFKKDF